MSRTRAPSVERMETLIWNQLWPQMPEGLPKGEFEYTCFSHTFYGLEGDEQLKAIDNFRKAAATVFAEWKGIVALAGYKNDYRLVDPERRPGIGWMGMVKFSRRRGRE